MFNENSYLVLDVLSKYTTSINRLLYANKVDTYDSVNFQEYNLAYMSSILFYLLKKGLLFIDVDNVNKTKDVIDFYENNQYFDLNRYDLVYLSPEGAKLWEEEYKPNWFNYIDVYYEDRSYTEPVTIELISMNKALLLDICQHSNQDKLKIENLDEWEICYWKKVQDVDIFKFTYVAETIEEKILIDEVFNDLSSYKDLFCKKTEHFF